MADLGKLRQSECHQLTGSMAGKLAVTVHRGVRIVFEPAHDPPPRKSDGGLDWTKVVGVTVLKVEDYHGR